ncbi:MAG: peptidylarginine deiminase-like enzyme [Bacteroidota bacterium]|nr:peptidylarginine deiminase-like enzyme [Bacteroidota bacterium]
MKKTLLKTSIALSFTFLLIAGSASAQQTPLLPIGFAPGEEQLMGDYLNRPHPRAGITTPPTQPIRTSAQWEESQALLITWTGFPVIHRQIVAAAQLECKVIIHCADSNAVKTDLTNNGIPLTNVKFIEVPFNSIWIRDYAANTCYLNDVDSLVLVDWIYNRPRPDDDDIPLAYSSYLNVPLYQTHLSPNNLVNTGGNWMVDGLGTALASELILDENDGSGQYSLSFPYPNHTESQIDQIMSTYHGINRYIKMPTLPYDGIHHIDMHMKFLDEKTILVGEFPNGVSDGPQMEANIQYVLSNFNNAWGDPYKIIRVPMPPSTSGAYAPNASYRTYSNFVIVNKTIIMPVYRQQYDTTAVRIIRDAMPGYRIVTIDADNSNSNIIAQSGVIHCITHCVGVSDPLRIVHNYLNDTYNSTTPYQVDALIQHKSGIQNAQVYWTTDTTQPFNAVSMSLTNATTDTWTGYIPAQAVGSHIYYYIKGHANSGKEQVRPMPAPTGNFEFRVLGATSVNELGAVNMKPAYPNPSHGITCIPVSVSKNMGGSIRLYDMLGNLVTTIFEGQMTIGEKNYFINSLALDIAPGAYHITVETEDSRYSQKLMVK